MPAFNLYANKPCAAIALKDATFAEMGLNSTNINIIYIADNPPYAWNPTKTLNPFSGVIKGQGYFIYPKVDLDMTEYFAPPLTDIDMLKDWVMQNYAELSHTHTIEQIEGLQEALDGIASASHTHDAADIISGMIATARLGSGTADGTTILYGDGTWKAPSVSSNDVILNQGNIIQTANFKISGKGAANGGFEIVNAAGSGGDKGFYHKSTSSTQYASLTLENNGSVIGQLVVTGSAYASTIGPNSFAFNSQGAGGIAFQSQHATAPIVFYLGGNTVANEKIRFAANGNILIGSSTDNGNKLQVNGSATVSNSLLTGYSTVQHNTAVLQVNGGGYFNGSLTVSGNKDSNATGTKKFYVAGDSQFHGNIHQSSGDFTGVGQIKADILLQSPEFRASSAGTQLRSNGAGFFKFAHVGGGIVANSGDYTLLDFYSSDAMSYNTRKIKGIAIQTPITVLSTATSSGAYYGYYFNPTITVEAGGEAGNNIWAIYANKGKSYFAGNVLIGATTDNGSMLQVQGSISSSSLAGTGTRMVVADASGILSTQAIPSGASITASNGLTLSGSNVILGGTLSGHTTIYGSGTDFDATTFKFDDLGTFSVETSYNNITQQYSQLVVARNHFSVDNNAVDGQKWVRISQDAINQTSSIVVKDSTGTSKEASISLSTISGLNFIDTIGRYTFENVPNAPMGTMSMLVRDESNGRIYKQSISKAYTPTSSTDTNGTVGDITYDTSYMYVKQSDGWKRAALSTF